MQVHVFLSLAAFIDYSELCSHTQMSQLLDPQHYHSNLLALIIHSLNNWASWHNDAL